MDWLVVSKYEALHPVLLNFDKIFTVIKHNNVRIFVGMLPHHNMLLLAVKIP